LRRVTVCFAGQTPAFRAGMAACHLAQSPKRDRASRRAPAYRGERKVRIRRSSMLPWLVGFMVLFRCTLNVMPVKRLCAG
jgi:hypothetical protein